jgi:hypothetical protein
MRRDLSRRIDRILERLPPDDAEPPKLIWIRGGIGALEGLHADIGPRTLEPFPGEPLDDFTSRALDLASEAGVPFVFIGGSPRH